MAMKTLTVKNRSGKHMSTFQAGTWKRLARMYAEIMKRNTHLRTYNVSTRGNHATVTVTRA